MTQAVLFLIIRCRWKSELLVCLEQLKNPYCFRYGDMAIKLEFAEDGPSLQELLTGFFPAAEKRTVTIRYFQTLCPEVESSLLYPRCRGII